MADEVVLISLLGRPCTLYALLAFAGFMAVSLGAVLAAPRHALKRGGMLLCALLSGVLGLFLGRAVYCAVRADTLFYGAMGEFLGLAPFFDPALGGVSVVGAMLGVLIAAPLCAGIARGKAADYADAAALPAILYLAYMRLIEPLSRQGYGTILENPLLCFAPLARTNAWGDWFLSVSFLEAVLALALAVALVFIGRKTRRSGSLALYAAALLSASQMIPESFRCDDVLYIFIFARVTQIGYAALLCGAMAAALARGRRRGLSRASLSAEGGLMGLGVLLCIGAEFALDKTNLPKALVYAVMLAALLAMAFLCCRRIRKEDQRA